MENKLYVYLPCYNEAENIRPLTGEWLDQRRMLASEGYELHIMPVDDKSTDDTLSVIQALEAENPGVVRVIAHEENRNLGGVMLTAVEDFLGVAGENDLMCVMDGDNTHKPRFVHSMIQRIGDGYGCVIASRYQPGAEVNGVPAHREFLSDGAKLYYSMMLHVPNVKDYTCGYRVYTYAALKAAYSKYGPKLVTMRTFSCMMEILYKLHKSGCRFSEVPFSLYYDDKAGASKMKVLRTVKDSLLVALQLRLGIR